MSEENSRTWRREEVADVATQRSIRRKLLELRSTLPGGPGYVSIGDSNKCRRLLDDAIAMSTKDEDGLKGLASAVFCEHNVQIEDADGRKLGANRDILSARSTYFSNMFASAMQEAVSGVIRLPSSCCASSVHLCLEYCYSGAITSSIQSSLDLMKPHQLIDLLFLADLLDLVDIQQSALQRLQSKRKLFTAVDSVKCIAALSELELRANSDSNKIWKLALKSTAKLAASSFSSRESTSPDFKALTMHNLCLLLKHVCNESFEVSLTMNGDKRYSVLGGDDLVAGKPFKFKVCLKEVEGGRSYFSVSKRSNPLFDGRILKNAKLDALLTEHAGRDYCEEPLEIKIRMRLNEKARRAQALEVWAVANGLPCSMRDKAGLYAFLYSAAMADVDATSEHKALACAFFKDTLERGVARNFSSSHAAVDFCRMHPQQLASLLACDELSAQTEWDVLRPLLTWARGQVEEEDGSDAEEGMDANDCEPKDAAYGDDGDSGSDSDSKFSVSAMTTRRVSPRLASRAASGAAGNRAASAAGKRAAAAAGKRAAGAAAAAAAARVVQRRKRVQEQLEQLLPLVRMPFVSHDIIQGLDEENQELLRGSAVFVSLRKEATRLQLTEVESERVAMKPKRHRLPEGLDAELNARRKKPRLRYESKRMPDFTIFGVV